MAMLLTMTLCLSAVCVNFMFTFDYRNVTISCPQRNKYESGPKCMEFSKTIEILRTCNKFKFSRSQIIAFISNSVFRRRISGWNSGRLSFTYIDSYSQCGNVPSIIRASRNYCTSSQILNLPWNMAQFLKNYVILLKTTKNNTKQTTL